MKQTFTLELECLDTIRHSMEDEFLDEILHAFRIGLNEYFGGWQGQNCSLRIVEQNHGTPESIDKKAFDLLNRAVKVISDYERDDRTDNLDRVAGEIEDYIRENTRET